jgi:ketosteroid isomerase-like protein
MDPSRELKEIIAGWFKAIEKGDASWVDRYMSTDPAVRLIGTDPGEWIAGKEAAEFLKNEAKAMAGAVKVMVGDLEAYQEGTVGWGIIRPTVSLANGKSFTPRWGAVFHQEKGAWKLVQLHASVGVPNEQLLG